jgi:hypothetical protein
LDKELRMQLGIKPGNKVCLFNAPNYLLPAFTQGDLQLMMDWAESGSDAVVYWLQPEDNVADIVSRLEGQIKRNGRIWLVMPVKEIARRLGFERDWEEIRSSVLDATSLVDNKKLSISGGEFATQFVFRKTAREEAALEQDHE